MIPFIKNFFIKHPYWGLFFKQMWAQGPGFFSVDLNNTLKKQLIDLKKGELLLIKFKNAPGDYYIKIKTLILKFINFFIYYGN